MTGKGKRLGALLLTTALLTAMVPGDTVKAWGGFGGPWGHMSEEDLKLAHGTSDTLITEDMLTNTPPADYVVDEAIHMGARDGAYNAYFLEEDIQEVRIEIDENNLNYLLQNAEDEPYVMTNSVTIGDTTLGYCGLKTKGSYTLEHSYTDNWDSDRFSFTVNFGKYIKKKDYGKKQNFYGCNKISFNNFYFDKSMMKEFFALKLMDEMGLPTPQYGLAKLYINDNYYGVYAMVEALDESILEQYYGVDDEELSSYLCKPEGTGLLYEEIQEDPSPLWENDEDTYADVEDMLPTVTEWVRKLNCLSEGKDFEGNTLDVNSEQYLELLEQVLDTDEAVRYFAVHSWLCQMDNMFVGQKNYGLYVDRTGRALIMPWDYDLSFGCYYPSTSEATANYDIDVMYSSQFNGKGSKVLEMRAGVYREYPLFHVIYQNTALMEKYHNYMKECSQIAALGGTVEHTGKSYDPGYFNSYIERMEEEIIAAAGEKLAENVYYMNRIQQPRDVGLALPNLSKIIAMRSVGVFSQVEGLDLLVTGQGCNLSTLGNASQGKNTTKGTLTLVDGVTGIFVTADYPEVKAGKYPMLTAGILEETEELYGQIRGALDCGKKDYVTIYAITDNGAPDTAYTLNLPLKQEYMQREGDIQFYSYWEGAVTELAMAASDNLYIGTAEHIEYIAVVQKGGFAVPADILLPLAIVVVVMGGMVFAIVRNKSKANMSGKAE